MDNSFDILVIGAGIVGLSTAYQINQQRPDLRIGILEKESGPSLHQTGHNSGVIHSGIYYMPGSEKAVNCRKGYDMLLTFCEKYDIDHEICGKVIVATQENERPFLDKVLKRGLQNGLTGVRKISAQETKEIEPHVAAVEAVWVPQAGIVNYKQVAEKYLELFTTNGGTAHFNTKVLGLVHEPGLQTVRTSKGDFSANLIISCAGLYSDKLASMSGIDTGLKIIPFRGEYYDLKKEKQHLVNNLIYPVPNPAFPFLGVHYTRMIEGGIEAGPSAVLAFKREGYSRWDIHFGELWEVLAFKGFHKIVKENWKFGLGEIYRSFSKRAFVKALQHLIPDVGYDDLERGNAGVRAMACDKDGNLIDDFRIFETAGAIHLCNAPSPAATASLSIGNTIAQKAIEKYAMA
ncbi:MAG: L-2-hydroxyglutarate oxidase [Bacteroidetes bacterium]|nr:MAG: L-2-hydroxyglutarate oxidase [Bacteroidota bacterium]